MGLDKVIVICVGIREIAIRCPLLYDAQQAPKYQPITPRVRFSAAPPIKQTPKRPPNGDLLRGRFIIRGVFSVHGYRAESNEERAGIFNVQPTCATGDNLNHVSNLVFFHQ